MKTQSSCRKLMAAELACVFLAIAEPWVVWIIYKHSSTAC